MSRTLFTVGYEGSTIDKLISRLRSNNINCVVDVRQVPFSRKPGFSKNNLSRKLRRAKIEYVHFGELGAPKALRDNLKATGNYSVFSKRMDRYLVTKKGAIEEAHRYVMNNSCCLMCFEHFAAQCHRKIVAEKIKAKDGNGLHIEHI